MPNGPNDVAVLGAPNHEILTDNGDGTVTDGVTKLMWQQVVPAGIYTQDSAVTYCAALTLTAAGGWRLPTVIELVSLVDYGKFPAINPTAFPGATLTYFWSSTLLASTPNNAWRVYAGSGAVDYDDRSNVYAVRCVR